MYVSYKINILKVHIENIHIDIACKTHH